MSTYLGLDWGGRGWIGVCIRTDSDADSESSVCFEAGFSPSILNVWRDWRNEADRILIDMPIGLPSGTDGETGLADESIVRACDRAAKEYLGPERRSSVFNVPCREAISESNYGDASDTNRRRVGRGLSTQAWAIAPRISEVEALLLEFEGAQDVVREAHPEVCFAALGDGNGVDGSKTTVDGRAARLEILSAFGERSSRSWGGDLRDRYEILEARHIDDLEQYERLIHASNRDDLLDAFALAVTARTGDLRRLPSVADGAVPTDDETGLPMEIVYHEPTN